LFGAVAPWNLALLGGVVAIVALGVAVLQFLTKRAVQSTVQVDAS
jgi:hypothetical protein